MKRILLILPIIASLLGCGDDGLNRVEESGFMEFSLIQMTSVEPLNSATAVTVSIVGQPGAVPNRGTVSASNIRNDDSDLEEVSPTGSFVLSIGALLGDDIALQYALGESFVDGQLNAAAPVGTPVLNVSTVNVSLDNHGNAIVNLLLSTAPAANVRVFVSNHNNQHVVVMTPHMPTDLVGTIPAQSGDTLLIYPIEGSVAGQGHAVVVP